MYISINSSRKNQTSESSNHFYLSPSLKQDLQTKWYTWSAVVNLLVIIIIVSIGWLSTFTAATATLHSSVLHNSCILHITTYYNITTRTVHVDSSSVWILHHHVIYIIFYWAAPLHLTISLFFSILYFLGNCHHHQHLFQCFSRSSDDSTSPRARRSSIVVIPPMQICPGDLLVYGKCLSQRKSLLGTSFTLTFSSP